jgi:hypothetical protein
MCRVTLRTGIVGLFSVAAVVIIGCDGMSPFLSAQFASNLMGMAQGGGPAEPEPGGDVPQVGESIVSVCELPAAMRSVSVTLVNQSEHPVRYVMTLAVSAGPGGFVCDDEVPIYLSAGYRDAAVPTSNVGCEQLRLLGGNRMLTLTFGVDDFGNFVTLPENPSGEGVPVSLVADSGTLFIPLPELIVFGNEHPDFICGDNLCSQRGFVYSSAGGLPIGKPIEALRIQGTLCSERFGTAPEWRLDKAVDDDTVLPFEFAAGGTIVLTILDREDDDIADPRNQAVWLVTDGDGNIIQLPDP